MRIVQAAGWYFPTSAGGTEVYVAELSRRLRDAGHDVRIAAPDPASAVARSYSHDGFPVFRYPIAAQPNRKEVQGLTTVRGAELFHEWLTQLKPDVVHMHTFATGLGLPEVRAARGLGARVIATTHSASLGFTCQRGTMMQWGTRVCGGGMKRRTCVACYLDHRGAPRPIAMTASLMPFGMSRIGGRLPGRVGTFVGMHDLIERNRLAQAEMLDLVDRFVVLNEWSRDVLLQNGAPPEKVLVNRLGVRFAPLPRQHDRRPQLTKVVDSRPGLKIAYIGRFDPIKGVEDLARAIGSLPASLPVSFEFYGPVQHTLDLSVIERVKALVRGGPWVTFGPPLDADGVRNVLTRIDLVCCPSRIVEGGPTIALEANAAGVPVIGTDVPALTEIVADGVTGRLVPANDWRALAAALSSVIADPGIVSRWRSALTPVRTMDDVTRDYLALYGADPAEAGHDDSLGARLSRGVESQA